MKRNPHLHPRTTPLDQLDLSGKHVIVVGGTGGLGRAFSQVMAMHGASVTVVGQTFRDKAVQNIRFIKADLSLMKEATRVADQLPVETADLILFTTGIMAATRRQETPEGIERDMAISYLSRLVILRRIAPRIGRHRPAGSPKPRVFIMGFPGSGNVSAYDDLNSERRYAAMTAHMYTVTGNEALLNKAVHDHPDALYFGLNPGMIPTGIRSNFVTNKLLSGIMEGLIRLFSTTPEKYAARLTPILWSPTLEGYSGAIFNQKGQAILASPGMTADFVQQYIAASEAVLDKAGFPE